MNRFVRSGSERSLLCATRTDPDQPNQGIQLRPRASATKRTLRQWRSGPRGPRAPASLSAATANRPHGCARGAGLATTNDRALTSTHSPWTALGLGRRRRRLRFVGRFKIEKQYSEIGFALGGTATNDRAHADVSWPCCGRTASGPMIPAISTSVNLRVGFRGDLRVPHRTLLAPDCIERRQPAEIGRNTARYWAPACGRTASPVYHLPPARLVAASR